MKAVVIRGQSLSVEQADGKLDAAPIVTSAGAQ
jgi:hypothetical protein